MSNKNNIIYLANGDILEGFSGWCLNQDKQVELTCQYGVMGGLYTCPYCGLLDKRVEEQDHVFEPSKPLLNRLLRND
jgi:hypothetical protein